MGQKQDEIITTDSQASMCLMAEDLPESLQTCKHQIVLEGIVSIVVELFAHGSTRLQLALVEVECVKLVPTMVFWEMRKPAAATDASKCSQDS